MTTWLRLLLHAQVRGSGAKFRGGVETGQEQLAQLGESWGRGLLGTRTASAGERRVSGSPPFFRGAAADKCRDGRIWAYRATYLAMLDRKQEAAEALERALSISPKNPDVQFRAALVYNHFGDSVRTLQRLQDALALGATASSVRDTPDFDHLRADVRFRLYYAALSHEGRLENCRDRFDKGQRV